jgi:hypothetical protein
VLQIVQTVNARIPTDEVSVTNVNQAVNICQQNLDSGTNGPPTDTPSAEAETPLAETPTEVTPALPAETPTP